jgi:muramoyltetrapeptide carboxypeptidase LdcA involved in peptidoglycan recycling
MRRPLIKPSHLRVGDRIAVVTPSWGAPGMFRDRYEAGKRQLEEAFGVTAVDMRHTLASPEWVADNPAARAQDIMEAFADSSISAVFASIGGDDSIRLLPFLDLAVIRAHPKIFLGFSDTTALHLACHAAGLTSFYGPSIMAGFAENGGIHRLTAQGVQRALFLTEPIGLIGPNEEGWTAERTDWSDADLQARPRRLSPADPPRILQGDGVATGPLLGGCAEVLEMVKGAAWWPSRECWEGAILFYETSEEAPSPHWIRYWLRNFAAQGILGSLAGVLLARPDPKGDETYQRRLEAALLDALAEAGLRRLPVLSGLDFGHTMPMITLPYGVQARIDCASATLTITESGVV